MNFSIENSALFDRYLSNEMEGEERAAFEARLVIDVSFKDEFEAYQEFEETIKQAETAEIYDRVKSWDQSSDKKKPKSRKLVLWISTAAAAAIVLLVVNVYSGNSSNEQLVDQYFEPYGNIATVRGKKEVIDKGLAYYDQERFRKSISQFELYPDDTLAVFYSGEAHLALKNYQEAVKKFDSVIQLDIVLSEVALFHKSLALIGMKENSKARKALSKINKHSAYYDRAKELLEHLK